MRLRSIFPKIFWIGICLVEHESYLDTRKITKKENESKNYGLFQINSRDYCTEGKNSYFFKYVTGGKTQIQKYAVYKGNSFFCMNSFHF